MKAETLHTFDFTNTWLDWTLNPLRLKDHCCWIHKNLFQSSETATALFLFSPISLHINVHVRGKIIFALTLMGKGSIGSCLIVLLHCSYTKRELFHFKKEITITFLFPKKKKKRKERKQPHISTNDNKGHWPRILLWKVCSLYFVNPNRRIMAGFS